MNPSALANISAESQSAHLIRFKSIGDPLADNAVEDLLAMPKTDRGAFLSKVLHHDFAVSPDLPESWRLLLEQASHIPFWVNWKTMSGGSRAFLRAGGLGMFSLGCYVTPLFYCLSNGNKALSFSGDLKHRASRRGRETARFVIDTCLPNNLRRHGDGFKITLRVRLMHAQVRKMIEKSGRWNYEQYGVPINQIYMASMMSLLSAKWIEGIRHLGFKLTPEEEEGVMQLWRYSSYLIGVDPELQFVTKQEALRFWALVLEQEPPPDEDAGVLVSSILEAIPEVFGFTGREKERMNLFCEGLAVSMLGDELNKHLHLKKTVWRHSPRVLRVVIPLLESIGRYVPAMRKLAQFHGTDLWLRMAEYPPQGGLEMFAGKG